METAKRHDWGLVVAGVLLVALALFFTVAPGLTLVTITAIAGAGFLVALCGEIMRMPALPVSPNAMHIYLDNKGNVQGL